MDNSEQRDYAEEKHNREFCIPCGTSPCSWDGEPDGFHDPDAPLVTPDAALAEAGELDGWSPADLLGLVHTAGELWLSTDRADPDDVLSGYQRSLLERAAASHLAATGSLDDFLVQVPEHHNDLGDWCPRSGEYSADGACPLYCRHADDIMGIDADRDEDERPLDEPDEEEPDEEEPDEEDDRSGTRFGDWLDERPLDEPDTLREIREPS